MADNLTRQLQEELKKRGRTASLTQIDNALKTLSGQSSPSPSAVSSSGLFGTGPLPEHIQQTDVKESSGSALNAVGAALWSFADSAAFGIPGAFIEEEEFIDFDDPAAQWTSAIGGFAGFIGGAPLKTGMAVSKSLAKIATKGTGKKHVDEVVSEMVSRGRVKGLSDDTIKEVTGGYKNIVNQAQYSKELRGGEFIKKSEDFLGKYLARAEQVGELNAREVAAVKNMFGPALKNRPLQDWYGVMTERGIFANNPRAAKALSHIINDAVMLAVVDTTFEGITMFEDGHFDWTQPMWGAATGVGFGALGWLMPKGAAASWKKDILHGMKAAFGKKDIYKKMSSTQLEASAQFWGESLKKSERLGTKTGQAVSHLVDIKYKGQTALGIDLTKGDVIGQLKSVFGGNADLALREYMEKDLKVKFGKDLMKFATKEAAGNLAEVWPRMIAGGALFNLHSFYEMARNGAELGVNDILPHFLIGAYIQRHANPAKFDMSAKGVNRLRGNLMRLGMGPGQFNEIPTLRYRDSSLNSPFRTSEWSPVHDLARDLGVISSAPEVVETPLKSGEKSMGMLENRSEKFEIVYEKLINHGEESMYKPIEAISVSDANKIMEEVYKINKDLRKAGTEELLRAFDKSTLSATKDFEQEFIDVVESVRRIDDDLKLPIEESLEMTAHGENNRGRVPQRINVSNSIKKAASDGLLTDADGRPLLVDENGNALEGQDALEALNRKIASFNTVLTTVELLGAREKNPNTDKQTKEVDNRDLLRGIFKTIDNAESSIQSMFPDNRHMQESFTFHGSFNDYIHILSRNVAKRSAESVAEIFAANSKVRSGLISQLIKNDLLIQDYGDAEAVLRMDVSSLRFEESTFKDKDMDIYEARRLLGRVLTIQAASGGYRLASEGTKSVSKIKYDDVQGLKHFLSEQGFNIRPSLQRDWMHNQIVDHIVGKRVENTRLSLDQTDALFDLADKGLANFEASAEGRAAGFSIKKFDLDVLKPDTPEYKRAKEYNDWVDQLIADGKSNPSDSEGLVAEETAKMIQTDPNFMRLVDSIIHKSPGKYANASQAIVKFIAALPSDGKSYDTLQRRIEVFINNDAANASRLVKWLLAAKVISKPSVGVGNWKVNEAWKKNLDKITEELIINMEVFGYDAKHAEETYTSIENSVKDRLLDDVSDRDKSKPITLQRFWQKYRFGGRDNDNSQISSKEMSSEFQKIIYNNYADVKNGKIGILHPDIFKRFVSNVYVENADGLWGLLRKDRFRESKVEGMLRDYAYLVGSQHRQTPRIEISFDRGNLKVENRTNQRTGLDVLMSTMGMEYYRINPVAPVIEDVGGRYTRIRHLDIFSGWSQNINKDHKDVLASHQREFQGLMDRVLELPDGSKLASKETGLVIMRIGNGTDVIAIERGQYKKLFDPFKNLYEQYKGYEDSIPKELRQWKKLIEKIERIEAQEKDIALTPAEAEYMLHRITHKEMLTGTERVGGYKDDMFVDFLNGKNAEKVSGRIKLMHTKKFTRFDKDFVDNLSQIYEQVEKMKYGRQIGLYGLSLARKQRKSRRASTALKRLVANDGFGVLVWNDEQYNTVRADTEAIIKREMGANYKDWQWDDMMRKAHEDTSAFDSIAFVNESTIIAAHALMGHNHNSRNPIKPVISSHGEGKPLLLGKTLLVYTKELDSFFRSNPDADILLTKSAAKVMNSNIVDGTDKSMINRSWNYISGKGKRTRYYGSNNGRLRRIGIDALGLKPEADKPFKTSPESLSNFNYANNFESGRIFTGMYQDQLFTNLDSMQNVSLDPIAMRQFIISEAAKDGLVPNIDAGNQSLREINNIVHFATYSRDANPLSYSDNIARNKLYSMYINSLVNNKRSIMNQFDKSENNDRYGGNSIIIQSARASDRLRPTIVDKNGNWVMRGEVMLSEYESRMRFENLANDGYELRFVENKGVDIRNIDDILSDLNEAFPDETFLKPEFESMTLGQIHEIIQGLNTVTGKDAQIGVIVNRKPRTRPNDMTILGLKGFLDRDYGNSIQLSSLDVVNVFEGDYDVDKADYFFAHKNEMWNHVHRTQQFWINGVDPSEYKMDSDIKTGQAPSVDRDQRWRSYADNEQFTKNIGSVQKVPRALSSLENIADVIPTENLAQYGLQEHFEGRTTKIVQDGNLVKVPDGAKVLLSNKRDRSSIVIDYQHQDFFFRSALETQYIIDGSGKLNPNISDNLRNWKNDFLFPTINDSVAGAKSIRDNGGMGFVHDIKHKKNSKRVRVFRKFQFNPETNKHEEVDLTAVEKAVIKEMLSQYNTLLNATGKTMWENSGDQRQPRYNDVIQAGYDYKGFMNDLSNSIYYNLRHRRIDPSNDDSKAWKTDNSFRDYFGVEEREYVKYEDRQTGKQIKRKYWKPLIDIFEQLDGTNRVSDNARQVASGTRGAVVDRLIMNFTDRDPFQETSIRSIGGEKQMLMESWFQQLRTGDAKDTASDIDRFQQEVIEGKWNHTKKVKLIGNLKKKIININNSKLPHTKRQSAIKKINDFISQLESEIPDALIPKEYRKSKKYKDLKAGIIGFKWIGEEDIKEGTIQYSAIDNLQSILPYGKRLNKTATEDLKEITGLRRHFFSNQDTMKDILKYNARKTILDSSTIDYLGSNPDLTTFYEIEHQLLLRGLRQHGFNFILQYMKPSKDSKNIGVHNGRLMDIPYAKSTRYKRGLQFLTRVAEENPNEPSIKNLKDEPDGFGAGGLGENAQEMVKQNLRNLQTIEAQFNRFFNNQIDRINLIGENLVENRIDVTPNGGSRILSLQDVRLPDLQAGDNARALVSFGRMKWSRDRSRISDGFNIMNDHLINLYRDIATVSGQKAEFEQYLADMNDINALLMSSKTINPIDYLANRASVDIQMRKLAQSVLTDSETMNGKSQSIKNIKNNPVYALMGGGKYFNSMSLEKTSTLSHERLRSMQQMFDTMNQVRENVNYRSEHTSRDWIHETRRRLKEGEC